MTIWDGSIKDTTNFSTDKFLQINSCGFQNAEADYTVIRKNGRKDYHILLVSSGKCEVLHNGNLYNLTAGNMVIYAPYEEQKYSYKTKSSSMWCHFTGSIVKELLEDCDLKSGAYFLSNKVVLEAFSNLIRRFNMPGYEKSANALLLELIYAISDASKKLPQINIPDVLLPVLSYINANYNKQITVDELAKKSGYSKSRFSHIFSAVLGTTPIKYQNDLRLKLSCEMLVSTRLSISDIAINCGFSDPLYYSRVFKKKYGISPSEFRLYTPNK